MQQSHTESQPNIIYRKDYTQPNFWVKHVDLDFDIDFHQTRVLSRLQFEKNSLVEGDTLILDGKQLETIAIRVDGRLLAKEDYTIVGEQLRIANLPEHFLLETEVIINPAANTALEGLYQSSDFLLTQCEAEGFRKITWYPDRPDVMATFHVSISADKAKFPVLLSNGNPLATEDLADGRHRVVWQDPHPKPAYLFALVAGELDYIQDYFTTASGRKVSLRVYVEKENIEKCDHAMQSLVKSMQWDEQTYGLEYDLDHYNIVATNDFNMGAMENKGLNVFNTKYVLAIPETATDFDFQGVEGVIAHEYFHNWTGNRVTCQDWFQLTLKEGLTVYRDQEFSSDMQSRSVKLIEEVRGLRALQYPEDAGPMAHPIRPDQYIEINNFYTKTVYEKGAQIIRMYETLLGKAGFRRGMDLYFERHDGAAVSCDDFLAAMSDANNYDLKLFSRWYSQSGTPEITATGLYHADKREYRLTLSQTTPTTADQAQKQALLIPVRMGLLAASGETMDLRFNAHEAVTKEALLLLDCAEKTFVFTHVDEVPVPSLLRGFSAPVKLKYDYTTADLALLMAHDSDDFVRWESSVRLALKVINQQIKTPSQSVDTALINAFSALLENPGLDPALVAEALTLPGEDYIAEQMETVDVDAIHAARCSVMTQLGLALADDFRARYAALNDAAIYSKDAAAIGRRALKNRCLAYLSAAGELALVEAQLAAADNMTDTMAALTLLVHSQAEPAAVTLAKFAARWQSEALVMDKWFALQATTASADTADVVTELLQHPAFSLNNPNKVRALLASFAMANPVGFHSADGRGYRLFADQVIKLNIINPQIAARMAAAFNRWKRFDSGRQTLMKAELQRIAAVKGLSPDVYEIVSKALA
ncbi:MAG: aminopeptidase N [Xanthomonadales bacterium]|nr:aminopeptidase N [Xanthomonadales bacterium]